jgi:hypothetical protein
MAGDTNDLMMNGWSFGTPQNIPTNPPPQTYTGTLPTPPTDTATSSMQLPHDYYRMQSLLNLNDPNDARLNRLMQIFYLQRAGQT